MPKLLDVAAKLIGKSRLLKLGNFYPPFLGAGIHIVAIAPDFRSVDVQMRLRPWTRNYVGSHFGGSLYAMVDPFFMLMLIERLGKEYIVWDKAATIRFKRPGRGLVRAHFEIADERVEEIRQLAAREAKVEPQFSVRIVDADDAVVAEVDKLLYVRRKDKVRPGRPA